MNLRTLSKRIADGAAIDWEASIASAPAAHRAALRAIEQLGSHDQDDDWSPSPLREERLAGILGAFASMQIVLALLAVTTAEMPHTARVSPYFQLTTMGVAAGTAALLAVAGWRDPAARGLALLYVGVAAAFAGVLAPIPPAWMPQVLQSFTAGLLRLPGELALIAGAWIFTLHFPRTEQGTSATTLARFAARAAAILAFGLLALHVALEVAHGADSSRHTTLASALDRRTPGSYYWTVYFAALALTIPVLAAKFRLRSVAARRRLRYFIIALAIGLAPISILSAAGATSDAAAAFLRRDDIFPAATLVVFVGLWALPLFTAVAVLAPETLPLRWAVGKSLQYSLARSTLTVLVAGPLLIAAGLLLSQPDRTIAEFLEQGGSVALGVASVALGVALLRQRLLRRLDAVFRRSRPDARQLIAKMGSAVRRRMSARDAADVLMRVVEDAVHPRGAALLIVTEGGTLSPLLGSSHPLNCDTALAQLLEASPEALLLKREQNTIARLLPAPDRHWADRHDWHALIPLHGHGEVLIGAVCLGPPAASHEYSEDDRVTLEALCSAAGPVLADRLMDSTASAPGGPSAVVRSECTTCGRLFEQLVTACPCGGALTGSVLTGVVAGRYQLVRRLGAGGMGVVYEAVDEGLGRTVALKTLPELGLREAEQLRREARMMASLEHSRLAYVLGLEMVGRLPVLVVEYLAGGTLADRLKAHGALGERDVVTLGMALADALDYLHGRGVLHRDLKPTNVGFTSAGEPKLLDFGVAVAAHEEASHDAAGTMLYMAPELFAGEAADPLCDLWSLVVLLCEAWIGDHPLRGLGPSEQFAMLASGVLLERTRERFPARGPLAEVLGRGLAGDRSLRHQSAGDLRAALQQCAERA